jgi:uncharacterized RDD family membrane protein YckC
MSSEYNPYSAPASAVTDNVEFKRLERATKGLRFGTLLIDYVFIWVFSFLVGIVTVLIFGPAGAATLKTIPPFALGIVIVLFFYTFFEGIWGRTPGKFILGTVVVNAKGEKPSLKQIVGRTFCRMIPFEAFSFFGEEGWHDSIPNTRVVLKRSL